MTQSITTAQTRFHYAKPPTVTRRHVIVATTVLLVLAALGYKTYSDWQTRRNLEIRKSVTAATAAYSWLTDFVHQLDLDKKNRYRTLLGASPDDLAALYVEQLDDRFRALPSEAVGGFSVQGLADHVAARNQLSSTCQLWPQHGTSHACREAQTILVTSAWQDWYDRTGSDEDYYLYKKEGEVLFGAKVPATVEICNLTPYPVGAVAHYQPDEFRAITDGWYPLSPGQCTTLTEKFSNVTPLFFVHTSGVESARQRWVTERVNEILAHDADPSNDVYQAKLDETWTRDAAATHCVSTDKIYIETVPGEKEDCPPEHYRVAFHRAATHPDLKNRNFFGVEHPNLSFLDSGNAWSDPQALAQARQFAEELGTSVTAQLEFDESWAGEALPFSIGAETVDFNGPLNRGVGLEGVVPYTLFGRESPLRDGDVLVSLNEKPVFSERDLNQILIRHGLSRDAGINRPLRLVVWRDGFDDLLAFESTYFFNESYRDFAGNYRGLAFWYGVLEPITFGGGEFVTCAGGNVIRFAGNLFLAAMEGLCKGFDGQNCGDGAANTFAYHDVSECTWQQTQLRALAEQKHRQLFNDSQWIGIFLPSGIRLAFGKTVRRNVARSVGRGALSRALADASLEAVETALWSLGTAPPGEPLAERLSKARTDAAYGAGLGFVSGLVLSQ